MEKPRMRCAIGKQHEVSAKLREETVVTSEAEGKLSILWKKFDDLLLNVGWHRRFICEFEFYWEIFI
jgi:hypothetical protein